MRKMTTKMGAFAMAAVLTCAGGAWAETAGHSHDHDHGHDHSHSHAHDHDRDIYKGLFRDDQVKARPLTDWAGDWQSVYPYLNDGTLDEVMAHKAESGKKTAAEYHAYYEVGYKTDVDRIEINQDLVTFHRGDAAQSAHYASDGHEVLNYEAGNRGVRYIFVKTSGDAAAPQYIQFSDHGIAPAKAGHYHLYWGNDRTTVLNELTNWPTYYPKDLSGAQVAEEMMAH